MLDLTVQRQRGAEASAPDKALERHASAPGLMLHGFGLAARVLAVTIGFVFLAMGLFYVTRLTAHREMWLHGKISAAQTTVEAFGLAGPTPPPQDLAQKILHSVDVKWLAVETPTGRREFVLAGGPPVGAEFDHRRRQLVAREPDGHLSRRVRRASYDREAERACPGERTGDRVRL